MRGLLGRLVAILGGRPFPSYRLVTFGCPRPDQKDESGECTLGSAENPSEQWYAEVCFGILWLIPCCILQVSFYPIRGFQ